MKARGELATKRHKRHKLFILFFEYFVPFCGLLLLSTGSANAQESLPNVQVHVLPVQGNIYMLVGAGGNITVQASKDGVLVVDTQSAPLSDKVLAAIRTVSDGPIRYIINTAYDDGNRKMSAAKR